MDIHIHGKPGYIGTFVWFLLSITSPEIDRL